LQEIASIFVGHGITKKLPLDVRPQLGNKRIEGARLAVDSASEKGTINRKCHRSFLGG